MNIAPLTALPFITAPQGAEPAAPGGSEADHGVALEFAVLLAGLLRTPVPTQATPVDDSVATSDLDADDVVPGDAEPAEHPDAGAGVTLVEANEGEPATVDTPRVSGWAILTAPRTQGPVPVPAPPPTGATPVETDAATPPGPATDSRVPVAGAEVPATLVMSNRTDGRATESRAAPPVATIAPAVSVPTFTVDAIVVETAASRPVDVPAPEVEAVAKASGVPAPTMPDVAEPAAVHGASVTAVVARLAEAVAATVRHLLGQDAAPTSQTAGTEATDAGEGAERVREGHAPAATRATGAAAAVTGAPARATAGPTSDGGGNTPGGRTPPQERTTGGDLPTHGAGEAARSAFADLARLAGAASAGTQAASPSSAAPAGVVTPPVVTPPDLPPPPTSPQTVTVRFDGPGGSEHRIRVSVRGDLVHATILTDAHSAPRLEQSLPELQRALADRGFSESRVSVRIMATDGTLPLAARPELGSSDASRQRDGQGRPAPERDFAGDDRPRGKRDQTGEEAHT